MTTNVNNRPNHLGDIIDYPTIALFGAILGFLLTGVLYATCGALMNAPKGDVLSWSSVLAGVACIVVSVLLASITSLYWAAVPARHGAVYPRLFGFGIIIAMMSFFSMVMMAAELSIWVENLIKNCWI